MSDMQRVVQEPTITVEATLRLHEAELRWLSKICKWGAPSISKALSDNLGSDIAALYPGLSSLHAMVHAEIDPILRRTDAARAAFKDKP